MTTQNEKITALYERLSRDDLQDGESISIANQKTILEAYARQNGFTNIRHFSDDGTSGTVFNRPGLNAMLEEIKAGNVIVVIIKDQSRIGRDVLEVGLLKRTFEEHNVRFIAANDNLDTAKGFDIMSIFRDVFNEWYVADASKKARASKRTSALQGKCISRPPFGYKITEDKSVWVVDEEAAEIVREIFKRLVAGENATSIARNFNERGLPRPNDHFNTANGNAPTRQGFWHNRTIIHLAENASYVGRYIAGRYTTPSYKNHKRIERPQDEWIVIENHHPAIIELEVFENVQRLRQSRRRLTRRGDMGELSGLLFCADCGSKLGLAHQDYDYYICGKYRSMKFYMTDRCTRHGVRRSAINQLVLERIQRTVALAISDKEEFARQVNQSVNKDTEKVMMIKTAELGKAERRVSELDKIISRIYEDHILGKLTEERFSRMLAGYEAEQAELSTTVETLRSEVEELKRKTAKLQSFIKLAEQHGEITELMADLTAKVARTFIERIIVHEAVFVNANRRSKRTQEIQIFLNYIGEFNPPK